MAGVIMCIHNTNIAETETDVILAGPGELQDPSERPVSIKQVDRPWKIALKVDC